MLALLLFSSYGLLKDTKMRQEMGRGARGGPRLATED